PALFPNCPRPSSCCVVQHRERLTAASSFYSPLRVSCLFPRYVPGLAALHQPPVQRTRFRFQRSLNPAPTEPVHEIHEPPHPPCWLPGTRASLTSTSPGGGQFVRFRRPGWRQHHRPRAECSIGELPQ